MLGNGEHSRTMQLLPFTAAAHRGRWLLRVNAWPVGLPPGGFAGRFSSALPVVVHAPVDHQSESDSRDVTRDDRLDLHWQFQYYYWR
jgi:hypothetical protein